jgi:hypothetical protein
MKGHNSFAELNTCPDMKTKSMRLHDTTNHIEAGNFQVRRRTDPLRRLKHTIKRMANAT